MCFSVKCTSEFLRAVPNPKHHQIYKCIERISLWCLDIPQTHLKFLYKCNKEGEVFNVMIQQFSFKATKYFVLWCHES